MKGCRQPCGVAVLQQASKRLTLQSTAEWLASSPNRANLVHTANTAKTGVLKVVTDQSVPPLQRLNQRDNTPHNADAGK